MTTTEQLNAVAEPQTDAWYAARKTGIGSSEAAAANGLSRWSTPREVYERKVGTLDDRPDSAAMWWGRALEPLVVERFCMDFPATVERYPCPMYRWGPSAVLATPDALVVEVEDGPQRSVLECKTTGGFRYRSEFGPEGGDDLPNEIVCQCQQQLLVTGLAVCHVAVLVDGRHLKRFRVDANPTLQDGLKDGDLELWERVCNHDPPEHNWEHARTPQLIRELYGCVENATVIDLTEKASGAWGMYEAMALDERAIKERRAAMKAPALAEIGDNYAGRLPDGSLVRRKLVERRGYTVDPKSYVDVRRIDPFKSKSGGTK